MRWIKRTRLYWTKNRKIERHENLIQKLLNRVEDLKFRVENLEFRVDKMMQKEEVEDEEYCLYCQKITQVRKAPHCAECNYVYTLKKTYWKVIKGEEK